MIVLKDWRCKVMKMFYVTDDMNGIENKRKMNDLFLYRIFDSAVSDFEEPTIVPLVKRHK